MSGLRLMLITRSHQLLKLTAGLLALLAIIYLHVVEFVLTFCLGGFIPGTDIEISALTAMYISCMMVMIVGYVSLLQVRAASARRRRYYAMRRPVVARESRQFAAQMAAKDGRETARGRRMAGMFPAIRRGIADTFIVFSVLGGQALLRLMRPIGRLIAAGWLHFAAPFRRLDDWLDLQFVPADDIYP